MREAVIHCICKDIERDESRVENDVDVERPFRHHVKNSKSHGGKLSVQHNIDPILPSTESPNVFSMTKY